MFDTNSLTLPKNLFEYFMNPIYDFLLTKTNQTINNKSKKFKSHLHTCRSNRMVRGLYTYFLSPYHIFFLVWVLSIYDKNGGGCMYKYGGGWIRPYQMRDEIAVFVTILFSRRLPHSRHFRDVFATISRRREELASPPPQLWGF